MFPFQSLFKKKSVRDLEAKLRFRRGKTRIQKYVREARKSSDRYRTLARDAQRLGDVDQFRLIGSHFLRLRHTITRWERFLVKLEALELRRDEVGATRDFLQSIDALTTSINRGASPDEIARMQGDIERAIDKSHAQEEMLDLAMEAACSPMFDAENDQMGPPTELEEPTSKRRATHSHADIHRSGTTGSGEEELDREIEAALGRLRTKN